MSSTPANEPSSRDSSRQAGGGKDGDDDDDFAQPKLRLEVRDLAHPGARKFFAAVNAGEVLGALQREGLGIVDVSTREADLEDVFLNLTRAAAA